MENSNKHYKNNYWRVALALLLALLVSACSPMRKTDPSSQSGSTENKESETTSVVNSETSPITTTEAKIEYAPADQPPSVEWSSSMFSLKLYDEWSFDEEASFDSGFRFIPAGDDRQGIAVENVPMSLEEFSDRYQEYVDVRLTGDWATSWKLIFEGDAKFDAYPGSLALIYDIYKGSEYLAKMMIIAIQGHHEDTFVLTFWEELEHDGVPSYYDQAMRIFESFTFSTTGVYSEYAPADDPPTYEWSTASFSLLFYDGWSFDEEESGDTYFRFVPQGDDRQALVVENIPMPLNEFLDGYYQEFVDARLTGDWVTSWELVYGGDAYIDALPGATMLTYHLYNGSEWTATLMIVAIQGNHADTFTLAFWEELGHEGVPSYFNQVMKIIESITLLN